MARRRKEFVIGRLREKVIGTIVRELRRLPLGTEFLVTVEKLETGMSDAQRGLFWIWMRILADEIGDTPKEIYKRYVKYTSFLEGRGLSELSDEEMSALMNDLQHYFADQGYYLPSGQDEYYEALEQMQAKEENRND